MSASKPPTFKLDDDKDVLGRLCALSWFDGVRGEYELLVNVGEDDARDLVAMLSAWLDAPRLAALACACGAKATMGARCMACASRESE